MEGSVHLNYQIKNPLHEFMHEQRLNALIGVMKQTLADIKQPRILDVGCGRGELMSRLREELDAEVFGVDIDPQCVAMSRTHGPTWQGTVEEVWQDHRADVESRFDLVVSSHSMEHMPAPCETMSLLKKFTKKHLLVAIPNPHYLPNLFNVALMQRIPRVNQGHYHSWDAPHLQQFLENQVGLDIVGWHADFVKIVPGRMLRNVALRTGFLGMMEGRMLPRLTPRLANSLIALCALPETVSAADTANR